MRTTAFGEAGKVVRSTAKIDADNCEAIGFWRKPKVVKKDGVFRLFLLCQGV